MYHLLKLLKDSKIVKDLDILNSVDEEDIQVLYVKVILIDNSILYIREVNTLTENKYSYHWQTKTGKLICRWDNAPHYPEIETFPHHKHEKTSKNILLSQETILEKILELISKSLKIKKL